MKDLKLTIEEVGEESESGAVARTPAKATEDALDSLAVGFGFGRWVVLVSASRPTRHKQRFNILPKPAHRKARSQTLG